MLRAGKTSQHKPVSASEREARESRTALGARSGKRERDKEGQSKGDRDGETDRDTENGRPRKTTIIIFLIMPYNFPHKFLYFSS